MPTSTFQSYTRPSRVQPNLSSRESCRVSSPFSKETLHAGSRQAPQNGTGRNAHYHAHKGAHAKVDESGPPSGKAAKRGATEESSQRLHGHDPIARHYGTPRIHDERRGSQNSTQGGEQRQCECDGGDLHRYHVAHAATCFCQCEGEVLPGGALYLVLRNVLDYMYGKPAPSAKAPLAPRVGKVTLQHLVADIYTTRP